MGSCSSRDFDTDGYSDKGSKQISVYGSKQFSKSLRYNDSDVILLAYNGDILTLRTAIQKKEMPQLLSIRGFSQIVKLYSDDDR